MRALVSFLQNMSLLAVRICFGLLMIAHAWHRWKVVGMPAEGATVPVESSENEPRADRAGEATKRAKTSVAAARPVDQRQIFTSTLLEMLINARLRLDTSLTADQPLPGARLFLAD